MKLEMTTTPKKFCFVLMPFESNFEDIYRFGIKQSCIDAGAYCERVDEQIFNESILDRIYNQISKADIIIADMTNRNPNVFYEVGYAHALGKTTILLTQNAEDIPFDLKHYPHIIYNNKITTLKEELTNRVKWCVENQNESNKPRNNIEIFWEDINLVHDGLELSFEGQSRAIRASFTIHNNSYSTFKPGDYRIGIITDLNYPRSDSDKITSIMLPDQKVLHMYPDSNEKLYPFSYTNLEFNLRRKLIEADKATGKNTYYSGKQDLFFRIFTDSGVTDYRFTVLYV